MARILVACFSQTGNTEKIAQAIHEALVSAGHDSRLKGIEGINAEYLEGYDLVFLGSACHSSTLAPPVLEILRDIPVGSSLKVAGFASHSCLLPESSKRSRELFDKWASGCHAAFTAAAEEGRLNLIGYFGCVGAPSPPIEDFIHSTIIQDEDEWLEYISDVSKHPDADDLEMAGQFALKMLDTIESSA